jgi:hypothetical protein
MKKYWILIISVMLYSCDFLNIVGTSNKSSISYRNSTNHKIEVITFSKNLITFTQNSTSKNKSNFILESNKSITAFKYSVYLRKGRPIYNNYLGFVQFIDDGNYVDSVIVIYDDTIKVTHNSKFDYNKKTFMNFYNKRNITYGANYSVSKFCETKHDREKNYEYTFFESDYLEAKAYK